MPLIEKGMPARFLASDLKEENPWVTKEGLTLAKRWQEIQEVRVITQQVRSRGSGRLKAFPTLLVPEHRRARLLFASL